MKGNERIGLTAEMAALIRSEKKVDPYSNFFVTQRVRRIYQVTKKLISKNTLDGILEKRVRLSRDLHKLVKSTKADQIIELACGSSTFGLEYSQKHSKLTYIETDLKGIIEKKKRILKSIYQSKKCTSSPSHYLIPLDVLSDDFYKILKMHLKKGKRTIVFAEGLTSYLSKEEFEVFNKNLVLFFKKIGGGYYISHETVGKKMTSSTGGKLLRSSVSLLTRSRSTQHFHSREELIRYYSNKGLKEVKHIESISGSYIFILELKK